MSELVFDCSAALTQRNLMTRFMITTTTTTIIITIIITVIIIIIILIMIIIIIITIITEPRAVVFSQLEDVSVRFFEFYQFQSSRHRSDGRTAPC